MLVPSQWEEALASVSVLARINNIPIIASNLGGIPEAVGLGGILIDRYNDIESWISAVKYLDSQTVSIKDAQKDMAKFDVDKGINNFISVLKTVDKTNLE